MQRKTVGFTLFAVFISITGAESVKANPAVELQISTPVFEHTTCVEIQHACAEPSAVGLYLDGASLLSYTAGVGDLRGIPYLPCLDTEQFSDGQHTLSVSSTCDGITTQDSQQITVDNPGFRFAGLRVNAAEHAAGDTISLIVDMQQPGLALSVDFSSVDSSYVPSAETVIDQGDGTYEVSYSLTSVNARPVGVYAVTLSAFDGTDRQTYTTSSFIRYSPNRTGLLEFGAGLRGTLEYAPMPNASAGSVQVLSATIDGPVEIGPGDETTLRLEIWSAVAVPSEQFVIDLGEVGHDGYRRTSALAHSPNCGSGGCYYEVDLPVSLRPGASDAIPAGGIGSSLVINASAWSGGQLLIGTALGASGPAYKPETEGPFVVRGRVSYARITRIGEPKLDHSMHPQFGRSVASTDPTPLADVRVRVRDQCGSGYKNGLTAANGSFEIIYDTECAQVDVELVSETDRDYLDVEVRDWSGDLHVRSLATIAPSDIQDLGDFYIEGDERGPWAIIGHAVRLQHWTKFYIVQNAPILGMPPLAIRYERDLCPAHESSEYNAGTDILTVCSLLGNFNKAANRDELDEHAITHEFFHWYQDQFMPAFAANGEGYPEAAGAFGEGFATAMEGVALETPYHILSNGATTSAESLEFQGDFKTAGNGALVATLPSELYEVTGDKGTGGWSWRIIWDFFDGNAAEPESDTEFVRRADLQLPAPPVEVHGNFDSIGSSAATRDVVVSYLGGANLPGNLPNDPNGAWHYDAQGFVGVEMTEFVDGMLCRGHIASVSEAMQLVHTVMDFDHYIPQDAPPACP